MVLMEQGPDGLPDPATEVHVPLHRGSRFVVDTQRLWHVVVPPRRRPALRPHQQLRERPRLSEWIAAELGAAGSNVSGSGP